ncbi:MAG: ArsB/NhaD family transporter [Chloroflexi bacterium]|nr:ArsB/NhaD family transporter [Chloroflexota bacterium]
MTAPRQGKILLLVLVVVLIGLLWPLAVARADEGQPQLTISGYVRDTHGEGVADAELKVSIGGQSLAPRAENHEVWQTDEEGAFLIRIPLGAEQVAVLENPETIVTVQAAKPTYAATRRTITAAEIAQKNNGFYVGLDFTLVHIHNIAFWIVTLLLLLVYVLISLEIVHRTAAALLGAAIPLLTTYTIGTFNADFHILSFQQAVKHIDLNVIFLLMGMMILVTITARTGVFPWLAVQAYSVAGGSEFRLAILFAIATAVLSALLDNVTTMLLMVPVTVEIALILKINPWPLLLPEIFASNLGGAATLIGDPPNLLIGSYANFTFVDFLVHMTPAVIVSIIALVILMRLQYGREYRRLGREETAALLAELREHHRITDSRLLRKSLIVFGVVILLFLVHGVLHMEPSIAALSGAAALLLWTGADIVQELEGVEWPSLIFFIMLFIVVGAAEEVGLIQVIADGVNSLAAGNLIVAILLVLWVSAFASMIIDNIPFTVTMLPVVAYLTQTVPGAQGGILYWALAFGACFGGNGTLVAASANIVTAGLAERAGYHVTFRQFLRDGIPVTIVSVAIAMIWLLVVGR